MSELNQVLLFKKQYLTSIKKNLPSIIKYVGTILTIISIYYVLRIILSLNFSKLEFVNIWKIVAFSPLLILFYTPLVILGGYSWQLILEHINKQKISSRIIFPIFTASNFSKYIPGTVMQYAVRNLLGHKLKMTHKQIALSSLLEIVFLVATYCVLAIPFIVFGYITVPEGLLKTILNNVALVVTMSILCSLILFYLFRKKFEFALSQILELVKNKRFLYLAMIFFLINSFMFISIGLLYAIIFSLFLNTALSAQTLFTLVGVFIVAAFVGYLTPGSPAGLGIREYLLLTMLSSAYGANVVLVASIIHRITTVLSDSILYVIGYLVDIKNKQDV